MISLKCTMRVCFIIAACLATASQGIPNREHEDKVYKDHLEKMSRVRTVEDLKRIFKIPDSTRFKRQTSIPNAPIPPSICQPKSSNYEIPFTSAVARIEPRCLEVQRCGGCCKSEEKTCFATVKEQKQVNVWQFSKNDGSYLGTYTVDYEDDKTCDCKCKKQASECSATQTLDPNTCVCTCNVSPQSCDAKKQWSGYDCACVCKNHSPSCPVDYVWNKSTCQCDRVYSPKCISGTVLNTKTCQCAA